jgi:hypothetical protein
LGALNCQDTGALSNNQVFITGGEVGTGGVYGAWHWLENGNTSVSGNSVTISGGEMEDVWGGSARSATSGNASVSGNSVTVSGGVADYIWGGSAAGDDGNASANGNTVTISGGEASMVTGGEAAGGDGNASANGNTVEITGGTIYGEVSGGRVGADGITEALNNTVSISAGLPASTFGASGVFLVGGYVGSGGTSTGNTLQLASAGLSVLGLDYFQRFEFTLPATLVPGGAMLTTTDGAHIGTNSVVTVSAPGLTVSPGNVFTLIDCGTCNAANFSGTVAAASRTGTLNGHPYTISITGDQRLLLTINSLSTTTATSVPTTGTGVLAALGLLLAGLAAVSIRRRGRRA